LPTIQHFYKIISKGNEKVTVTYESDLNEDKLREFILAKI
jgi:hypothetical protein